MTGRIEAPSNHYLLWKDPNHPKNSGCTPSLEVKEGDYFRVLRALSPHEPLPQNFDQICYVVFDVGENSGLGYKRPDNTGGQVAAGQELDLRIFKLTGT